jgi:hypothetical protein
MSLHHTMICRHSMLSYAHVCVCPHACLCERCCSQPGVLWRVQLIDFGLSRKIVGVGMTEVLSPEALLNLQVQFRNPQTITSPSQHRTRLCHVLARSRRAFACVECVRAVSCARVHRARCVCRELCACFLADARADVGMHACVAFAEATAWCAALQCTF